MAITAITPVSSSTIAHGDSFSFTIDNTYTTLQIKVQTETVLAKAYDTALGGAQAGYTVSVTPVGGTDVFVVSRDAGWDKSPQLIYVEEDESGATVVTNISYTLYSEQEYPQGTQPYTQTATGGVAHGALTGLADDDHTQYGLVDATRSVTHTGDVTSTGSSTVLTIGAKKVTLAMMADGVDGELITYDASGVAAKIAVGTATHVLTSNGVGAAPTFQAPAGGGGGIYGYGSWEYDSSSTSGSGIAAGQFRLNNADPTAATTMYIRKVNQEGVDVSTIIVDNLGHYFSLWNEDGLEGFVAHFNSAHADLSTYLSLPLGAVVGDTSLTDAASFGCTSCPKIGGGAGDVTGPVSAADGGLALFDGTTGKIIKDDATFSVNGFGQLIGTQNVEAPTFLATTNGFVCDEVASVSAPGAAKGVFWVKNSVPSEAWFTDDAGIDFQLGVGTGDVTAALSIGVDAIVVGDDGAKGVNGATATLSSQDTLYLSGAAAALLMKELAVGPTPGATNGALWVKSDAPNVLVFTDDAGTGHTIISDTGVTPQDAVLITERADHVNTPSAGFGEIWVRNDGVQTPVFTGDGGVDWDLIKCATPVHKAIPYFNSSNGEIRSYAGTTFEGGGRRLRMSDVANASVSMGEMTPANAAAKSEAGFGVVYAGAAVPTVLRFLDDAGNDTIASPGAGAVTLGAAATTFAITHTFMTITGDGGGNTLATITGAGQGQILTLLFVDALVTITDDNTHAADSIDLSAAFTSADDTILQIIYDGTSWYEVSRSVN